MKERSEQRTSGFSLLEVVIGSLIFATIFGGFAATWVIQERGLRKYRDHNVARFLAEQEMERAMAAGFGRLTSVASGRPRIVQLERKVDGVSTLQDFSVTASLENKTDLKADLIVVVENAGNEKNRFELRTIVFKTI